MPEKNTGGLFSCLPVLVFLGYWLYACLFCALMTKEARMVGLAFVTAPLLAAMAAACIKALRGAEEERL